MKKLISLIAVGAIFAGCALLSPYNIIFTTPNDSVINPETDTLDLAVNIDALAYISGVSCEGYQPLDLLPIVTDDMEVSKAHNLPLGMLNSFDSGTKCEITVTAFDKTTTATSRAKITLHVLEKIEIVEEAVAICEDGSTCPEEAAEAETTDGVTAVDAADEEAVTDGGVANNEVTDETTDTNATNEAEATTPSDGSSTEE